MPSLSLFDFKIGLNHPLTFICGPCVIESRDLCFHIAEQLKTLFAPLSSSLIFKSSYDKANRSSLHSFRGPGLQEGLRILEELRNTFQLPILTDVHSPNEAVAAAAVCDVIQIPAFLCRQTDLLVAAGQAAARYGRIVNIKKGQFLAPWDMKHVVDKVVESGCNALFLTDRGTAFGYNQLVSDMRSIPIMQQWGYPVCFDATHSVQEPGGLGKESGGKRQWIPHLAKAAAAVGVDAIFMEVHPFPEKAKSDAASMLDLKILPHLVSQLEQIRSIAMNDVVSCS